MYTYIYIYIYILYRGGGRTVWRIGRLVLLRSAPSSTRCHKALSDTLRAARCIAVSSSSTAIRGNLLYRPLLTLTANS